MSKSKESQSEGAEGAGLCPAVGLCPPQPRGHSDSLSSSTAFHVSQTCLDVWAQGTVMLQWGSSWDSEILACVPPASAQGKQDTGIELEGPKGKWGAEGEAGMD